jgi:hypothetical protein
VLAALEHEGAESLIARVRADLARSGVLFRS